MDNTYYDLLQVPRNATKSEIKKNYYRLIRECHPDKLPMEKREWGSEKTQELNEAYDVLSDPEKRKIYDKFGKNGPSSIFDMFHQQEQELKAKSMQIVLEMTLDDLYFGKKIKKTIERISPCSECFGNGTFDKKEHKCTECYGSGHIVKMMRTGPIIQQVRMECTKCKGNGKDSSIDKCRKCKGSGRMEEEHEVEVDIKAGMRGDQAIVIEEEGILVKEVNKRGDIIFIIKEVEHTQYKRGFAYKNSINPANLLIELEIELWEALCGFVRIFNHLNGKMLYVEEQEIIKDGDIRIVKDYGMPVCDSVQHGDLFIKFNVKSPENLSDEQKNSIKKLLCKEQQLITEIPSGSVKLRTIDSDKYQEDTYDAYNDYDNYNNMHSEFHFGGMPQTAQCNQQ